MSDGAAASDPTTSSAGVTVRLGGPDDVDDCLAVLGAAYGRAFTREWFEWKHLECPWGSSRLHIAEDHEQILGLFLALDWPYRRRDGSGAVTPVPGVRLVDGATLPPARGRGVLGAMVFNELKEWGPSGRKGVLLATATPAAQKSHARNGATTLDPIAATIGVARAFRPAALVRGDEVLDTYTPDAPGVTTERLRTAWTPDTLRWRTDPRTGYRYHAAALASADDANGVIYRVSVQRRVRTIVPMLTWGSVADQRRLVGAVAWAERTPLVHAPVGGAVDAPLTRPLRRSGASVMCVWDRRDLSGSDAPSATTDASWSLAMADLEGLI